MIEALFSCFLLVRKYIPNPNPTTRFSCGLMVNSNTNLYTKSVFLPRFETLVVNLVVLWWKWKYSKPHPHHKIFLWSCGEFYYKIIYEKYFSSYIQESCCESCDLVVNLVILWWILWWIMLWMVNNVVNHVVIHMVNHQKMFNYYFKIVFLAFY